MSSDLGPAPDLDSVTPLSEVDPSVRDADFEKMLTKARVFLKRDPRVSEIDAEYLGSAIDGIIYIFLFKIGPVPSDGGAWFWVMVGDIPTAYASGEECKDPADALQAYIDSMAEWVEAARAGKSVEGLVPVNASPTPAYAEMLGSRLQFLEDNVMPILKGEEDNEEDDDEDDQGDESDEEDLSAEDRLPDLDSVTPLSEVDPSDRDAEFETMLTKARVFLERNQWVDGIDEEHLGAAFAGIVYIFLFKIRPAEAGIDSWYWVVVGDVPSAYATCGGCKDPPDALDAYIGAMTAWVEAARAGKSVADLVPVNISPTPEHAEMLRSRLQFLEENVMPILEGKEEDGDSGDGEDDARQDESDAGDPSTDQSDEGPLPDLDSVTPLSDSHPPGQDREFKEARKNAREKLASYPWAAKIEEEYLGAAVNGVVYIFLFKIRPARAGINSWIWVIEGDLPYAYLTGDRCTTPGTVLEGYIGAMEDWVEAARTGKSVAKLIPVNVPPTPANAESLGSKLKFLKKEILPLMQE